MDPNSAHQRWSFWEYRIFPDAVHRPALADVKLNAARFGRKIFGSASEMRIICATDEYARVYWDIAVLSEGHPVHDTKYVEWVHGQWTRFFKNGFGKHCEVRTHARLEAGDREDGKPADQLIILPPLKMGDTQ